MRFQKNGDGCNAANVFQPLGLAYIAAVLELDKHMVSILDGLGLSWKNLKRTDSCIV